jgi:hypothetical protein
MSMVGALWREYSNSEKRHCELFECAMRCSMKKCREIGRRRLARRRAMSTADIEQSKDGLRAGLVPKTSAVAVLGREHWMPLRAAIR